MIIFHYNPEDESFYIIEDANYGLTLCSSSFREHRACSRRRSGPYASVSRRNMKPCTTCSRVQLKCNIAPPYSAKLCERCMKAGKQACPAYIPRSQRIVECEDDAAMATRCPLTIRETVPDLCFVRERPEYNAHALRLSQNPVEWNFISPSIPNQIMHGISSDYHNSSQWEQIATPYFPNETVSFPRPDLTSFGSYPA